MKYFPFTFVGQLEVKVGVGAGAIDDIQKDFRVFWDVDSFNWRLKNCRANYFQNRNTLLGRYNAFVHTLMGVYPKSFLSSTDASEKHYAFKPKLYVGIGAKLKGLFVTVPRFVKHSPFNLIFLDLTDGKLPAITIDNILFQLFDFDVA